MIKKDCRRFSSHFKYVLVGIVLCLSFEYANAESIRIMPLGDSITYDTYADDPRAPGMRTGYRQPLWLQLVNEGYDVDFIGNQLAGQDATPAFDPHNAGFPGITAAQLVTLLATGYWDNYGQGEAVAPGPYLDYYPADIILLHIGTNHTPNNAEDIENILNIIDSNSEETIVVVARIINQAEYAPEVTAFNDELQTLVNTRISQGDILYLVDMENGAELDYIIGSDMIDLLHPSSNGYTKMANNWFEKLKTILPEPNHPPTIISQPNVDAYVDEEYYYQLEAEGSPSSTFSIVIGPPGMVIGGISGLIRWIPDGPGKFNVSVQALNVAGYDIQNFEIDVIQRGDLNVDSEVDIKDLILVLKILSSISIDGPLDLKADPNGNSQIGIQDAIWILQKIAIFR